MSRKYIFWLTIVGIIFLNLSIFFSHSFLQPFRYHIVAPQNVRLIVEPDDGMAPILESIENASSSIDMVMYELEDQQVEDALAAAEGRGVSVRVILNGGLYGKGSAANKPAFTYLKSHRVAVQWSPSYFALTHQKTLIIDANSLNHSTHITQTSKAIIMTFNLVPKDYLTSRDFGIIDPDQHDIAAIEQAFDEDWNTHQANSVNGDDLVWSPNSKQLLLDMIASAKQSLLVSSEELEDSDVISALTSAAHRGVQVQVLMTNNAKWYPAFALLSASGAQVRVYAPKAALYIHEKIIIADDDQAFVGSQNLTATSLLKNRELGILISTPSVVKKLQVIFGSDWNNAS